MAKAMTDSGDKGLKEKLAAIEHERWADWQRWVHTVYENPTRPFEEAIKNWKRQIDTPYSELSDREKASDMEQVDRYWPLIEDFVASKLAEAEKAAFRRGQEDCQKAGDPRNHKYWNEAIAEAERLARQDELKYLLNAAPNLKVKTAVTNRIEALETQAKEK